MAEATKARRTIVAETVTLKLSKDEAETLLALFSKVGGDSIGSPRKHVDAIGEALVRAGVRDYTSENHPYQHIEDGSSIVFAAKRNPWRWEYLGFTAAGLKF